MRVLPALSGAVVVLAEHARREVLRFGIEVRAFRQHLRGFAAVIVRGVYPAGGLQHGGGERAGGIGVLLHPQAAGAEHFFRVIREDGLRRGGGEPDAVIDGAGVPRLADAEADHIADAHVHHHLRRRHHHGAHIVERMNARRRQPVVEPHGVGAGRKGMGEGVSAWLACGNHFFQRVGRGDAFFQQIGAERNRLAVLVERHQGRHRLRFTGDAEFQPVDEPVERMGGVELAGDQLVAHRRPARLFAGQDANAIFFIEALQGSHDHRRAVGERNKTDAHGLKLGFVRARGPHAAHQPR
ncbi:hypothetical protein BN136_757 [Cronobacter universalis NCTC 9529]|nr:hypothetical protein BN136_757 [Cronobacter universalis NCTC 9529]